jgi:hypothetical protein
MFLVIEFIAPMGESLNEALPSVQAGVDKGLDELGFARVRSHHSMTGQLACEKMYYKLRHGRAVKLEAIAIKIGAVVREESRQKLIEGTKQITRAVELTTYLERDWRDRLGLGWISEIRL